jgi:hypothetical protein
MKDEAGLVTKFPLGNTFWKLLLPVPTREEAGASLIALPSWSLATSGATSTAFPDRTWEQGLLRTSLESGE